ncbi:hypothetical protein ACOQFV_21895 [Nocardiopsis changdeensis]|uniref:Uncharacterized protein n=1 Tax=Nocardiopsis changdeensis TaxID=2831969 RepID=A0ABX8BM41_9ACTN|nr:MULTISPECIES: hypothetical protein [Nocardiopsis]QUX21473.1 hypothetical protein KGD84_24145 [Nocardiopsis changdeensis]QYX37407.1 hypothetical protein K1J57_01515 [Nocardiopsis sp. MT53]
MPEGTDRERTYSTVRLNCCMVLLIGPVIVVTLVLTLAVLGLLDWGESAREPRGYVPEVNRSPVATAPVVDVTAPVEEVEAPVDGIEAPVVDAP